ncbi:MAG: hypothetical protein KAH12_04145, partial [Anaerolineales bacterium]|nr:hypothetical protein [Anaerolineales bacterium]
MKRNILIIISIFTLLFLLSACDSYLEEDSGRTSRTADSGGSVVITTLAGTVADGYLIDARVFLDRNGNRIYDNGEPMTQSAAGGAYTLEVNPGEGSLYPIVVQVIAGQTIDVDTGVPITNGYLLESLPGRWKFVSPLTTLVSLECSKNPSLSEQQAEIEVRNRLGIVDSISLFSDYIVPANIDESLIVEYDRTHRAAQVAANIMGSLWTSISQNLAGHIADTEQLLVAYMVTDQIVAQAEFVAQALENERSQGSVADVSILTLAINSQINIGVLNANLLAFYRQRVEQNFDTWDMQPPQVQSQSPHADDTASVDMVVSVLFDEPLDETLLFSGIIELTG